MSVMRGSVQALASFWLASLRGCHRRIAVRAPGTRSRRSGSVQCESGPGMPFAFTSGAIPAD